MKTLDMNTEIKNTPIVKATILAIKVMWDCRSEKPFYNRVNWLDGMCSEYTETLSILFKYYAKGEETTKSFAKRLAGI